MKKACIVLFVLILLVPILHAGQTDMSVSMSQQIEIGIGERYVIKPEIVENSIGSKLFWEADNTHVKILSEKNDYSVTVIGMSEGETLMTLKTVDNQIFATCTVSIAPKVIKILAIGNSFSVDVVETNLYDLAKSEGITLIIGNMYIGGCDLETHLSNSVSDSPAYSYRKIGIDGKKTTTASKTLKEALGDEDWNYISFQQASPLSGIYDSYVASLPGLVNYVKTETADIPNVTFMLHQTWAYAQNSTHAGFVNYDKNQMTMYNAIIDAVSRAAQLVNIDLILPSGTAIQNGRTSLIGDNFCRDGYHLSRGVGRYTAACAWFEKLMAKTVVGNAFIPADLSAFEATIAQQAAHFAVLKPNDTTSLADIAPSTAVELSLPVNVDFGSTPTSFPWNNISSVTEGTSLSGLTDIEGNLTTVSITINDSFGGVNTNGPTSTSTSLSLPGEATRDSFWGNAAGVFSGKSETTGGFLIEGLTPSRAYDIHFFASRTGASDNRETYYTVSGRNEQTYYINAANNTSSIVSAINILPAENGSVNIKIGAGQNNSNVNKFFYINSLTLMLSNTSAIKPVLNSTCRLYPNPVKTFALIESDQIYNSIEIFNVSGNKVFSVNNLSLNKKELDLSDLMDGYYIVRIDNQSIPLIKQN